MLCARNEAESAKQSFLMRSECPNALLHQELRHRDEPSERSRESFDTVQSWKVLEMHH